MDAETWSTVSSLTSDWIDCQGLPRHREIPNPNPPSRPRLGLCENSAHSEPTKGKASARWEPRVHQRPPAKFAALASVHLWGLVRMHCGSRPCLCRQRHRSRARTPWQRSKEQTPLEVKLFLPCAATHHAQTRARKSAQLDSVCECVNRLARSLDGIAPDGNWRTQRPQ